MSIKKEKELTNWAIQTWVFGTHFAKNEQSELDSSRKQLTLFVANNKIRAIKQKLEFWKILSAAVNLKTSQNLKAFLILGNVLTFGKFV